MVALCSNRPEGFGPSSALSSPLPTTCFIDVILTPLPVWIYMALLPILLILSLHQRRNNYNPSTAHLRSHVKRSSVRSVVQILYYLLIFANILMQTLEIVRLTMIDFGVGLLPFSYLALLIALFFHITKGGWGSMANHYWIGANEFVWLGLMIMAVVKTVGLTNMVNNGVSREGSKYPVSDQVVDIGVMAGVYLVLAIFEGWLGIWNTRSKGALAEEGESVEAVRWGS